MPNAETITEQVVVEQHDHQDQSVQQEHAEQANTEPENADVAESKAELAKMKAALDKATKEAAEFRRALRAKQSAEEIAAEEQKAADEATRREIEELRREVARARTIKTVMGKLGTDEDVSGKIAEYLYGAEDSDAALTELQRAWTAREKAIRLEYGKIPAPGAGGSENEDTAESRAIKRAGEIGKAKAAANETARNALSAYMR